MLKILLDPGHTKLYNRSPAYPDYYEGDKMFEFAGYFKEALEKYENCVVQLTKNDVAEDPSLETRGKMAIDFNADLFISMHTNAHHVNTALGSLSFYSLKRPDSKKLCDLLGANIVETVKPDVSATYYRGSQTKKSTSSNGVDYYGVLRNSVKQQDVVPYAFLFEYGFHTNYNEAKWFYSSNNLMILATKQARVISDYFGLSEKTSAIIPRQFIQENLTLSDKTMVFMDFHRFDEDLYKKLYDKHLSTTEHARVTDRDVAKEILRNVPLSEETITYLDTYDYGFDLVCKLASFVN